MSFVLIQLVRNWKGDNLPLVRPDWAGGSIELMQDVSFSTARLFIIALAIVSVVAVAAIFRYTKAGLLVRATSQNRDMARALGVNTRRVDALTFAFGSGLAGIAGYGLYLIASVSPQMGQGYIVDSFLVVVVGGVGKLAGVVMSGFGIGFAQKMLEPLELIQEPIRLFDATWANVAVLAGVVLFIQRRPGGIFPERGRQANLATGDESPWASRPSWLTDGLMMLGLVGIGLVLVPVLYGNGTLSIDDVNRYGYFATYAICAVGLDLLWGYVGVLSLCQFLFFAFGAYAAGFYLINHGPKINGIPECLYYVMSGTGELTAPAYLVFFQNGIVSFLLALLIPGLLALGLGVVMFRSRVKGVYFAILTQTFTVIALRVFQKNELGMGGTNGIRITFTETLFGNPIMTTEGLGPSSRRASDSTRSRSSRWSSASSSRSSSPAAAAAACCWRSATTRRGCASAATARGPSRPASSASPARWRAWAAPCTCRRKASSRPATWPRTGRSSSSPGSPSAAAAPCGGRSSERSACRRCTRG